MEIEGVLLSINELIKQYAIELISPDVGSVLELRFNSLRKCMKYESNINKTVLNTLLIRIPIRFNGMNYRIKNIKNEYFNEPCQLHLIECGHRGFNITSLNHTVVRTTFTTLGDSYFKSCFKMLSDCLSKLNKNTKYDVKFRFC